MSSSWKLPEKPLCHCPWLPCCYCHFPNYCVVLPRTKEQLLESQRTAIAKNPTSMPAYRSGCATSTRLSLFKTGNTGGKCIEGWYWHPWYAERKRSCIARPWDNLYPRWVGRQHWVECFPKLCSFNITAESQGMRLFFVKKWIHLLRSHYPQENWLRIFQFAEWFKGKEVTIAQGINQSKLAATYASVRESVVAASHSLL